MGLNSLRMGLRQWTGFILAPSCSKLPKTHPCSALIETPIIGPIETLIDPFQEP